VKTWLISSLPDRPSTGKAVSLALGPVGGAWRRGASVLLGCFVVDIEGVIVRRAFCGGLEITPDELVAKWGESV
jgi:hypothetical protein